VSFWDCCEPVLGSEARECSKLVVLTILRIIKERLFESIVSVQMAELVLGSFTD
jgi:hypothetical protein